MQLSRVNDYAASARLLALMAQRTPAKDGLLRFPCGMWVRSCPETPCGLGAMLVGASARRWRAGYAA